MNSRTMAELFALCLGSVRASVWAAIWGVTPAKSIAVHEETNHAHRSGHGGQLQAHPGSRPTIPPASFALCPQRWPVASCH
jgi:hypothetical protein